MERFDQRPHGTPSTFREWPCVRFCQLDVSDPDESARFICWLYFGESLDLDPASLHRRHSAAELDKLMWDWDAPRPRMAKLLWQLLVDNTDPGYFDEEFKLEHQCLVRDAARRPELLPPLQERLRWVINAFMARLELDNEIGQGSWGEAWWLPREQADYVRGQLRRAQPDLLEGPSDFEDALRWSRIPYYDPPSSEADRMYGGGECGHSAAQVFVHTKDVRLSASDEARAFPSTTRSESLRTSNGMMTILPRMNP